MDVYNKKIIFVGGKGGVGKSTTSAAIALESAKRNNKTLLISTDPAHNIGHIFETKVGGTISSVDEYLDALEIVPKRETELYIKSVKENINETYKPTIMETIYRHIVIAKNSYSDVVVSYFYIQFSII